MKYERKILLKVEPKKLFDEPRSCTILSRLWNATKGHILYSSILRLIFFFLKKKPFKLKNCSKFRSFFFIKNFPELLDVELQGIKTIIKNRE